MSTDPEPTVTRQLSTDAGSCNGCTRHTTAAGVTPHAVAQIDLRSTSFRLCAECLAIVKARLEAFTL